VPLWLWGLLIGYLSVLFFAALWAAVERIRWAIPKRTPRPPDPEVLTPASEAHS